MNIFIENNTVWKEQYGKAVPCTFCTIVCICRKRDSCKALLFSLNKKKKQKLPAVSV